MLLPPDRITSSIGFSHFSCKSYFWNMGMISSSRICARSVVLQVRELCNIVAKHILWPWRRMPAKLCDITRWCFVCMHMCAMMCISAIISIGFAMTVIFACIARWTTVEFSRAYYLSAEPPYNTSSNRQDWPGGGQPWILVILINEALQNTGGQQCFYNTIPVRLYHFVQGW